MSKVYAKYEDDLDVAAIYAESLMVLNPWELWVKDESTGVITPTDENTLVVKRVLTRVSDPFPVSCWWIVSYECGHHNLTHLLYHPLLLPITFVVGSASRVSSITHTRVASKYKLGEKQVGHILFLGHLPANLAATTW